MLELQNHLYVLDADLQVRLTHLNEPRRTVVAVLQIRLGANDQLTSLCILTDPINCLTQQSAPQAGAARLLAHRHSANGPGTFDGSVVAIIDLH